MYRIGKEEIDAVARAIYSKDFFKINGSGREVLNFENEWKAHLKSDYCILMSSGFAAITSALIGLGIGPGDEVIVPGYTYIATALAVTSVGAIPVIAEVDETLTLDVEDTAKKISAHTKAIIPVHIQGFPSNMDGLCELAAKHGIAVIEDACQSVGGEYKGKKLGAIGDAGAHSFNYFKVMTAGEGGALVTNNRQIFERGLIYHDASAVAFFGDQLNGISEPLFGGTEFRVSDIIGAIMREQLKKLPGILADLHTQKFALIDSLCDKAVVAPSHDAQGDCATTLALRFETAAECRSFAAKCKERGVDITIPIDTGKHVYTNWTQIMEKRGALHPAMDPYKMKENEGLQMDYTMDMCPKTLDYLARTAYLWVQPDWTDEKRNEIAEIINAAL
ncbi:MAG: aminotransferase class I/II-fold pyridoxal phosphate-dependent enzyme [Ruminococcaceae bacterium]|nr:aminotransferase class I/II-fold pyridoxal phosphate-dependent enzyme [Oscillospiraceae bacterium]MBQ4047845.1 aminotransferase class I/II-fold pyridoxal phosphate-dependent enzyme [Clostridia bacterium]